MSALQSFADHGSHRRLVLIGDYQTSDEITRLNGIISSLLPNANIRFKTVTGVCDDGRSWSRNCTVVNTNHYLVGTTVSSLWDAATGWFVDTSGTATSYGWLVRTYQNASRYWIAQDNTASGCNVVLIHDSDMFDWDYDNVIQSPNPPGVNETAADTVPDKNFKFTTNLCSLFPQ